MTNEERRKRAQERLRNKKPHIAYISSDYAIPKSQETDEYFGEWYYYQISRTLGLESDFGHPEIETLITFSVDCGGNSVLRDISEAVRNGARFCVGDKAKFNRNYCSEYTVEFRQSNSCYGPCIRAVVLGIEEEYQSLSEKEAFEWIESHGPLIDPYEAYY